MATLIVLFVLRGLDFIEKRFVRTRSARTIIIRGMDHPGFVDEVRALLAKFNIALKTVSLQKDIKKNQIQIETVTKVFLNQDFDALIGALSQMDGLSEFKFH